MKRLESVKLVQYFLFERAEISFDDITGIFGRNGGGKSSLLDAIQIAMLGANVNLTALNAQADEHTNRLSRSLRAYCLGQHSPEQHVREDATTYITLVWRDTETDEPLSMGVCLSASSKNDTHEVLGRYVVRGVVLALADHLEAADDGFRPRSWKAFRHDLQERSRVTGEDPLFDSARSYVLAALTALRGSAGTPLYESFTRAFRFALRMRFDKDVDYIVRNDVLEARPTNVRKFRDLVDSFSRLNATVKLVEDKVQAGTAVVEAYSGVHAEIRRQASWDGLAASAQHAQAAMDLDRATLKFEEASEMVDRCRTRADEAERSLNDLELAKEHQQALQIAHAAHQDHAQVQAARAEAGNRVRMRQDALVQSLKDMHRVLVGGAGSEFLEPFRPDLQVAAAQIATFLQSPASLPPADAVAATRHASGLAASAAAHLADTQRATATELSELEAKIQDVSNSLGRARAGQAPLSQGAQRLLTEFSNHGLSPVPVCDLVRVKDPDWQPVIEAYLGRNVEALLVNESDETRAYEIYRELRGARAVYGVKIAMASKYRGRERPAAGSVAELIEGDNQTAVAYVRSLFGDIRCAAATGEALAGGRTLTKDGMLVGRGEFERLRLVDPGDLKIGAAGAGQVDSLASSLNALGARRTVLQARKSALDALYGVMSMAGNDATVRLIDSNFSNLREALNDHEAAEARAAKVSDAGYEAICQEIARLGIRIAEARQVYAAAREDAVRADEALKGASREKDSAAEASRAIAETVDALRAVPDYDKLFASDQWDKLLAQFGDDYGQMAVHCRSNAAACMNRIVRLTTKASSLFGAYLKEYRDAPGQETVDDWRKAMGWMEAEVKRLHDTELLDQRQRADDAYRAAQETFRTDVAIALSNNLDALQDNFDRLNAALRSCPVFSNGERYQFVRNVRPELKPLLKFVQAIAANGAVRDLLDAGEIPPEFAALLREKVAPGAAGTRSVLDDYREFFQFDIRIDREDPVTKELTPIGMLSKRLGPGSGGEHRAPLYVIAGAALASAYRLDKSNRDGLSLVLLDEAFDKMDMTNIVATMQYLEQLGLQVVMASPGENQGTLNAFLHSYYDLQRDTDNNVIYLEKHVIADRMRQLYRADLPEFNPELLVHELAALQAPVAPVP